MNKYMCIMGLLTVSCGGGSGEVGNDQSGSNPSTPTPTASATPTPSPTTSSAFYNACVKLSKCSKHTTTFNYNKCYEYNLKGKLLNTYYSLEELNKELKKCDK